MKDAKSGEHGLRRVATTRRRLVCPDKRHRFSLTPTTIAWLTPTPHHARTQHATSATAFASAAVRASDVPDSNGKNAHLATCVGKFHARRSTSARARPLPVLMNTPYAGLALYGAQ